MTLNVEALNEVGRIFDWRPDPTRYFASAGYEAVRQALLTNLLHTADARGVLVLAGEAGAGKTLLAGTVVQSLPTYWSHIAQLSFTVMSGQEIVSAIAYAFGMPPGPSVMSHQSPREWIETQLRVWTSCGEASLLVVDEAQNLPPDALHTLLDLNQLRLNEHPVMRVLLVGQPEFLQRLNAPDLPAEWAAHAGDIGPTFCVPTLTPDESAAFLRHRLAQYAGPALPTLTASAFTEIHARTQGRPGRINVLCQQLLHSAILLESHEPIDAAAVAIQADELLYHAQPSTGPVVDTQVVAPVLTASTPTPAAPPVAIAAVSTVPAASPAPAVVAAAAPVSETLEPPKLAPATRVTRLAPPRTGRPPQQPQPAPVRRLAAWSTGLVAIALVAGLTWFYTPQRPAAPHAESAAVTAPATPLPAPVQTPAPVPVQPPAAAAIATETAETPDPQTEALLAEPAASAALAATKPASPLPKELPHAPPITTQPPAAPKKTTAAAAPKPAPPATPTGSARCANLLAQMSLGEPITAQQRRVLETQCRQTK